MINPHPDSLPVLTHTALSLPLPFQPPSASPTVFSAYSMYCVFINNENLPNLNPNPSLSMLSTTVTNLEFFDVLKDPGSRLPPTCTSNMYHSQRNVSPMFRGLYLPIRTADLPCGAITREDGKISGCYEVPAWMWRRGWDRGLDLRVLSRYLHAIL